VIPGRLFLISHRSRRPSANQSAGIKVAQPTIVQFVALCLEVDPEQTKTSAAPNYTVEIEGKK
jgi:hypothetical protein